MGMLKEKQDYWNGLQWNIDFPTDMVTPFDQLMTNSASYASFTTLKQEDKYLYSIEYDTIEWEAAKKYFDEKMNKFNMLINYYMLNFLPIILLQL